MKRLTGCALAAVFALLPILAPAERRPLAVVEITSCNAFSGDVNTLAQAINTPFIAMGVNGWLGKASSCPNLTGVDVNKPLRLFVLPAETEGQAPVTASVLPLLDQGEILLGALRGAFPRSSQDGDILSFAGAQAGMVTGDIFVALVGNQAVTASSRAAVAELAAALKANALPTVPAVSGTLRATLDVEALTPLLEKGMQSQVATMRKMMPQQPGQMNPADMLELELSALVDIMHQTQSFSIGMSADASGVTLYTRVDPVAGSTVARVLALSRPPNPRYRALIPPNALFAYVGSGLDAMDLLIEPYTVFAEKLYAKMGEPYAQTGPLLRKSLADAKGLYTGDLAVAVAPTADGKGVELVEFLAVKDEQAAWKFLRTSMTNTVALMAASAKTGFGVQVGVPRKSGKTEILPFRYTFSPQDVPATPGLPAAAMAPFLKFFGNLCGECAVADGHFVMAIAGSNTVARTMDRALASLAAPAPEAAVLLPKVRAIFPEIQAAPVTEEWYLSSSDIFRLVLGAIGKDDAKLLAQLPPAGAGIGGIELRKGDAHFNAMRISASELTALSKAFKALQQPRNAPTAGRAPVPPHMAAEQPAP
jgi:hypothetical protein